MNSTHSKALCSALLPLFTAACYTKAREAAHGPDLLALLLPWTANVEMLKCHSCLIIPKLNIVPSVNGHKLLKCIKNISAGVQLIQIAV